MKFTVLMILIFTLSLTAQAANSLKTYSDYKGSTAGTQEYALIAGAPASATDCKECYSPYANSTDLTSNSSGINNGSQEDSNAKAE